MTFHPYDVSYFAKTNFRGQRNIFGIKQSDRAFHFYITGKSGSGKTTLLKTLMKEDVMAQRGFTFLDIHGDASREIIDTIDKHYRDTSYVYFDVTNPNIKYGYNPLRKVSPSKRSLVASSILEIFQRNWKSAWGLKMEYLLRVFLLTLLDQPNANLSDILRLIHSKQYRQDCQKYILSEEIRLFWEKEFKSYKANDLLPILNKVGALLSHSVIKKILVENTENQLSLRKIMDEKTLLIVNIAKGSVGADVSNIIGGLLLTSLSSAGFSRIDIPEEKRVPHYVYIDEFQTISGNGDLISELLAQSRKFKLFLVLCNQFLHQLPIEVRNSILGNVGTIVAFRTGISDANLLSKLFYPVFKSDDFTSLANFSVYLQLMIDGKPSRPFSADTIL